MITSLLNRPNNTTVNRLGLGSNWRTTPSFSKLKKLYNFFGKVYLSTYFKILFKSGAVYASHLFLHRIFFHPAIITMPLISSEEQLSKFFRLVRLKHSFRFKAKRSFLMRKYLKYLNISELFFFRLNELILVTVFIYVPEPVKRSFYLKSLDSEKEMIGRSSVTKHPEFHLCSLFNKLSNYF